MNPSRDLRSLLQGYLPMAALLVAIALFVAIVPTAPREEGARASTTEELLAAAGNGAGARSGATPGTALDPQTGQPLPSGPSSGTGEPGAAGAGGPAGPGDASGGGPVAVPASGGYRPTGQDCTRVDIVGGLNCRPTPAFSGDNGGSTYTNVDADEIRILVYEPAGNAQVEALLQSFGASSSNDGAAIDALEAFEEWFNANFETYGRRVRISFQRGPGNASVPDEQTADAAALAEQHRATIVLSAVGSTALHDELARRGILALSGGLQFREAFYEERAPFLYSLVPDLDLVLDNVAEYWCKRLEGGNAVHAGDPTLQGQRRRLGIIHPEDNQEMTGGLALRDKIRACGGDVAAVVGYASDVSTAQQQATNAIAQLRAAGVTTVTCTCDPIAPIFFTTAATNQGWFPEWLQSGVLLTDIADFGRLYNQQQWQHSFGVTAFGKPGLVRESAAWRAYFAAKPDGSEDTAKAAGAYFIMLLYAFSAIEAAGPNLNPTTFAQGMFSLPPYGGTAVDVPTVSFGAGSGSSPYTGIDDMTEIWWDVDRAGPDGRPGFNFYVEGGRRRHRGEWPSNPPNAFVDDGSPQPPRDPDK